MGEYSHRLVIPVYLDGVLVSFQARDMTEKADVKYRSCPVERSVLPLKDTVYGLDDVGDQVIIVEGVTDKWRMGTDAVALFGKIPKEHQIKVLVERCKHKKVKILLDGEGQKEATNLFNILSDYIKVIVQIDLEDDQEPDTLSQEDIDYIINYL